MKRIIISIVILAVLSGLCGFSVSYVLSATDGFLERIHEVEKFFEKDDIEKSVEAAAVLQEEWTDFMKRSILVNDLGHAVEITSSIAEIYSFAQAANEELFAACDRAEVQLEIFKNMQLPTFWKIL